jgi:hypothetical protein
MAARGKGLSSKSKMYLLAFGVWLGGMYLLATINHALFGIVLGSSMIIGGILRSTDGSA